MVFSSIIFMFYFLPVFLAGYYLSGWRTGVLLAGSVAFYVWGEGGYILLLAALIVLNHLGARAMAGAASERTRRAVLVGLIVLDLSVLGTFKYAGFLAHNLNSLIPARPLAEPDLRLPLGISFYTFQLISYAADVYLRRVEAERALSRFAVYILMFPHLIAGPIVRYASIRAELQGERRASGHVGLGLQFFIVGLCQKVLIANSVAPLADHAFVQPIAQLETLTAWVGIIAYSLQIYFDFGGYSNMAIGLAFLLGFTFPRNFNYPYAARSITEFWRRWHISLSSWFRDYVYIPLGGNRGGAARTARNLVIVFILTGVWHGAAWTFVAWGLFHGMFLLLERVGLGRLLAAAPQAVGHVYALGVVMVGWVLFRSGSPSQAWGYFLRMARLDQLAAPTTDLQVLLGAQALAALALGVIFAVPTLPWLLDRLGAARLPQAQRGGVLDVHILATPVVLAGLVLSVANLAGASLNPFLYFRF